MKASTRSRQLEIAEAFGDVLDGARRRRGLSLEILAKRSGIPPQHMQVLLSGAQDPKLGTFVRVAAAVSVSPTWLLEEIISYASVSAVGGAPEPTAVHDTRMRAMGEALASTLRTCNEQDLLAPAALGTRLSNELARRGLTVVAIPLSDK